MDTHKQRWDTLWGVQRSVRYHARRQAFFDRWHRVTSAISVILGSAAAADLVQAGGHQLALAAAFAVAVFSALDLVIGTAEMARKHDDLRRRFIALESSILADEAPSEAIVTAWCAERLAIESDEPPTYIALNLLCENEQALATGEQRWVKLGLLATLTAHLRRWENLTPKVIQRTA